MRFFTFEYQAFNGEINRETNRETNREFIGVLLSALSTDTTRDRNSFCQRVVSVNLTDRRIPINSLFVSLFISPLNA